MSEHVSPRVGDWDVAIEGSDHPQGLIALVGDGLPLALRDDNPDPRNALETTTPIQRAVMRARLLAWVKALDDYAATRATMTDPATEQIWNEGDEAFLRVRVARANSEQAFIEFVSMEGTYGIRVPLSELSPRRGAESQ